MCRNNTEFYQKSIYVNLALSKLVVFKKVTLKGNLGNLTYVKRKILRPWTDQNKENADYEKGLNGVNR